MSERSEEPAGRSLSALSPGDLAAVLSKVSGRLITEETIRSDFELGAPSNPNGTVNLIHYAAWLVKELSNRGD